MRVLCAALALASLAAGADAALEAALAQIARYNYDQGRQALLDLESRMRALPAGDVEKRFLEFLRSDATLAGKDQVCRQLSLIGGAASAPVLASMLSSPDTVEMARYALERIPAPEAAAALRGALESAPAKARPGIANTLGVKRDAEAVPALSRAASSTDAVLAEAAMSALGRIATPQAMTALASLRKKGVAAAMEPSLIGAGVRAAAGDRAGALAVYRELSAAGTPAMIRIGALQGLASTMGREAAPQLSALLEDSDARLQATAIRLLNTIPGGEVTSALTARMPKLTPAGRARVVTALAERGDRSALPAISGAIRDADVGVRTAAMTALAAIADPDSVAALAGAAASESVTDAERAAARAALDQMRGEAVDRAVVAALAASQGSLRLELIRAAGERAIAASAPSLVEAARSADPAVKREAIRALRETAGAAQVTDLIALHAAASGDSDRREVERTLAAALRRSPPARSAEVVAAYRSASGPTKASLAQVMGQSGTPEALAALLGALSGDDAETVRAAVLALAEWQTDEPLADLMAFAARTGNAAHQVLAQRAALRLADLPSKRPAAETVKILGTLLAAARQADEKRTALSMLSRYGTKEALDIADAAAADPAVAAEAKAAAQRIRRNLQGR